MKSCSRCRKLLPATKDFFAGSSIHSFGLRPECKQCLKASRLSRRRQQLGSAVASCRKCGQEKPRTPAFFRLIGGRISLVCRECPWFVWAHPRPRKALRRCISCHLDKPREQFIPNSQFCSLVCKEDGLNRLRRWKSADPLRTREQSRLKSVRFRLENPELSRARVLASIARHPERHKATRHRRRTAKGRFSAFDLRDLYQKQGGCCFYCEVSLSGKYHIDHRLALARGGTNDPSNLVLACRSCNLRKGVMTAESFISKITAFSTGGN